MNGDEIDVADLRPGMYVEVAQVTWRGVVETAPDGTHFTARRDERPDDVTTSWAISQVASVRLLPLPLPTTPGERFWGSKNGAAPCWWFVTERRHAEGGYYISQHGECRYRHEAGLVRLPEPEAEVQR